MQMMSSLANKHKFLYSSAQLIIRLHQTPSSEKYSGTSHAMSSFTPSIDLLFGLLLSLVPGGFNLTIPKKILNTFVSNN